MAAPGMIQNTQTPCYSKDHISYQNFSETTEILSRFFKNDIFPNSMKGVLGKMRKKDRKHERLSTLTKISKLHGKTRFQYPKFCHMEVSG